MKYEKLSFCGIYCGGCKNFKENYNCMGCRNETELVNDCPTRTCCIEKGLLHCGQCESFPCEILSAFYKDGVPHHQLAYRNMMEVKGIGIEKWLQEQEEKYTCNCGKRKHWFETRCSDEGCEH